MVLKNLLCVLVVSTGAVFGSEVVSGSREEIETKGFSVIIGLPEKGKDYIIKLTMQSELSQVLNTLTAVVSRVVQRKNDDDMPQLRLMQRLGGTAIEIDDNLWRVKLKTPENLKGLQVEYVDGELSEVESPTFTPVYLTGGPFPKSV